MKTSTLLLVVSILILSPTFAQIPNNGFETWTTVGSYSNPDKWDQLNAMTSSMSIYTCTKGTPGNPGSSYLKLVSKTISGMGVMPGIAVSGAMNMTTFKAKSGFAFTQQPKALTGSWQYMASGADGGVVAVYLTKWDPMMMMRDTVAKAMQNLSGMVMSWATFNINLTYLNSTAPDSAIIILSSSGAKPVANSYLYIDNLAFSGTVTGIDATNKIISGISAYPNPSRDNITIELTIQKTSFIKIQLVDLSGKVVKEISTGEIQGQYQTVINTDNVSKGAYFLKVSANGISEMKKLIIQ